MPNLRCFVLGSDAKESSEYKYTVDALERVMMAHPLRCRVVEMPETPRYVADTPVSLESSAYGEVLLVDRHISITAASDTSALPPYVMSHVPAARDTDTSRWVLYEDPV